MTWMILVGVILAVVLLWWLAPGVLGIILVPLAWLAAVVVWWLVPVVGAGVLMPIFQLLAALNPWAAAVVMVLLGFLVAWYLYTHGAHVQAIAWAALWGMGAMAAVLGWLNWYALFIEGILVVILAVPGLVVPGWANLLRWYAAGEIGLTLLLLWGQGIGLPGPTLVFALLLLVLAALLGAGAYRPFEARRIRRRLATMSAAAAVVLVLWQPILIPAAGWMGHAIQAVGQTLSASPLARWYRVTALRWERREIGETAKTAALQGLQGSLTEAHRRRWEKAVGQIPELPLSAGEWGDLGIPRDADP
jgi:hypothetical protein